MILYIEADFVDEQDTNKKSCYKANKNKQNKQLTNWRISLNLIKIWENIHTKKTTSA